MRYLMATREQTFNVAVPTDLLLMIKKHNELSIQNVYGAGLRFLRAQCREFLDEQFGIP